MLTQNFGAAATFQSFGFASSQRPQGLENCSCAPHTPYPQPGGYPQQPQMSGQLQMQMMMSFFMEMMSSMMQLQQGFGSYMGADQPHSQMPYAPQSGGYNSGGGYPVGGNAYNGGGYNAGGGYPQPTPLPTPAPAPKPPAKKGGYA